MLQFVLVLDVDGGRWALGEVDARLFFKSMSVL
jgi:hypothetical protein